MRKVWIVGVAGAVVLALAGLGVEGKSPVRDMEAKKRPNMAAAQKLAEQTFDKLTAAQKANEFDAGGHATKAKELLEQAIHEMKLASEAGSGEANK